MRPKNVYLVLCVAGLVIPYVPFVSWVADHGLNFRIFVEELFSNRISTFFGLDVLVSSVVVIVFLRLEGRRANIRLRWLPIAALLCVGVSLAQPLLLYLREGELNTQPSLAKH
jgi:hypothetical protein